MQTMNKIKFDDPAVRVYPGQIDKAIRILKTRVGKYGTFKTLRNRTLFPKTSDRKRFKERMATKRAIKARGTGAAKHLWR